MNRYFFLKRTDNLTKFELFVGDIDPLIGEDAAVASLLEIGYVEITKEQYQLTAVELSSII